MALATTTVPRARPRLTFPSGSANMIPSCAAWESCSSSSSSDRPPYRPPRAQPVRRSAWPSWSTPASDFREENNLRGGLAPGFGLILPLTPRVSLAVEFAAWKDTAKQSFGKLYNGTLTLAPILASVQYEFYRNRYFTAYALGGAAYIVSRFRIGSYVAVPEVQDRAEHRERLGRSSAAWGPDLSLAKHLVFYLRSLLSAPVPAGQDGHPRRESRATARSASRPICATSS